jgi:hypothetical protein
MMRFCVKQILLLLVFSAMLGVVLQAGPESNLQGINLPKFVVSHAVLTLAVAVVPATTLWILMARVSPRAAVRIIWGSWMLLAILTLAAAYLPALLGFLISHGFK